MQAHAGAALTAWEVVVQRGDAAWLHGEGLVTPDRRIARVAVAEAPAVVLGSSQAAPSGGPLVVCRRRSGGGAVLVRRGDPVWIDVCIPRGDELWLDDVRRAAWWVGETWATALGSLGAVGLTVHRGPMVRTEWSSAICWAGIGAGEVLTGDGAKVVGISQRRTHAGAIFQCAAYLRYKPDPLLAAMRLDHDAGAVAAVRGSGVGLGALGVAASASEVVDSVIAALPR